MACDPVVRATTYGGKGDPFVRVVDTINADGTITREVLTFAYVGAIDVRVEVPR